MVTKSRDHSTGFCFFAIECWKITLQRAQRNRDYCSLTAEQALTDILLVDNDNDDRRKLKTKAVKIECRTRAPNAYGVGLGLRWLWTVFLCIGHQLHNMKTNKCIGVLTKERKLTLSALGPRTYIIKTEQTDRLVNHCFAVFAVDTASVKRWSTTAGYWSVAYKSTVGYWKLKKAERLSGAMPSGVLLQMEVGIRKGAWRRAWRYLAYLWSLRWVYAVKKTPEVGIRRIPAYTPQYTTGYANASGYNLLYCIRPNWVAVSRSSRCFGLLPTHCITLFRKI